MAAVHDLNHRVRLKPGQRQALKNFLDAEAARDEARKELRDEAKAERAELKAKGFDVAALSLAVAQVKRDARDAKKPDLANARDLYLDALQR